MILSMGRVYTSEIMHCNAANKNSDSGKKRSGARGTDDAISKVMGKPENTRRTSETAASVTAAACARLPALQVRSPSNSTASPALDAAGAAALSPLDTTAAAADSDVTGVQPESLVNGVLVQAAVAVAASPART